MPLNRFYGDNRILKPLEYLKCGRCDKEYVEWNMYISVTDDNKIEMKCHNCGAEFTTFVSDEDITNYKIKLTADEMS